MRKALGCLPGIVQLVVLCCGIEKKGCGLLIGSPCVYFLQFLSTLPSQTNAKDIIASNCLQENHDDCMSWTW